MKQCDKHDNRPRFGWCDDLGKDPQMILEERDQGDVPVVVIPLPYMSSKIKHKIREFTNGTLWPECECGKCKSAKRGRK